MTFARAPNLSTPNQNQILLSGKAAPKSVNRQLFLNQQNFFVASSDDFSRHPILLKVARPTRIIGPMTLEAARNPNYKRIERIVVKQRILQEFELGPGIRYTGVELISFFNTFDLSGGYYHEKGFTDLLEVNVEGRAEVDFEARFATIKQHLRRGTIKLEWYGIHNIFPAKILHPKNHLREFVTGFFTPNFENYQKGNETKILYDRTTPVLESGMERVRENVTSLLSGLAIDMLLHSTPIEVEKLEYRLANYIVNENVLPISKQKPNANTLFYTLKYNRQLTYIHTLSSGATINKTMTISCTFGLFRVRIVENNKTKIETFLNLLTVYLPGNPSTYEIDLWANDMNLPPNNLKEKEKFNELKTLLTGTNLVSLLHEIYPKLDEQPILQADLKKKLNLASLDADEFYDSISW